MTEEQSKREELASQFLRESVHFLKSQNPSERNKAGIEIAGRAASFLPDKSLFHEFEQIWNDTPRNDRTEGRNFVEVVSSDPHFHEYKIISEEDFLKYLQKLAPERFVICSDSDLTLEEVLQTAKSGLDMEEIGYTYAVLGQHEKALEVANRQELEEFRRAGIRRTIEMEKLRQGDFHKLHLVVLGIKHEGVHPWNAGYLALCALGRLPYMGYPYPDW
jgi:hypothetical protein